MKSDQSDITQNTHLQRMKSSILKSEHESESNMLEEYNEIHEANKKIFTSIKITNIDE